MPLPCLTKANVCKIRENEGLFIQVKTPFLCVKGPWVPPGQMSRVPHHSFPYPFSRERRKWLKLRGGGGFYTGERERVKSGNLERGNSGLNPTSVCLTIVFLSENNFLVYQTGYNKSIQLSHIPPGNIFAKKYVTCGKFRILPVPPGNPFPLFPHSPSPPSRVDDTFGLMDDRPSPLPPMGWKREATIIPFPVDEKTEGEIGFCAAGGFEFKLNQSPFSPIDVPRIRSRIRRLSCSCPPCGSARRAAAGATGPGRTVYWHKNQNEILQKDYIFVFPETGFRTTVWCVHMYFDGRLGFLS